MIVVLLWYSDGSAAPEVQFFPTSADQAEKVALFLAGEMETGKSVRVFAIDALDVPASEVFPE